jgi:hypothetical protein
MEKKQFSVRLNEEQQEKLKVIAEKNNRSLNKQIEHILYGAINDYEKVNSPIKIERQEAP